MPTRREFCSGLVASSVVSLDSKRKILTAGEMGCCAKQTTPIKIGKATIPVIHIPESFLVEDERCWWFPCITELVQVPGLIKNPIFLQFNKFQSVKDVLRAEEDYHVYQKEDIRCVTCNAKLHSAEEDYEHAVVCSKVPHTVLWCPKKKCGSLLCDHKLIACGPTTFYKVEE